MLDNQEIFRKLHELIPHIILTTNDELTILQKVLLWLKNNSTKLNELFNNSELSWLDTIDTTHQLEGWEKPYNILGIDGSQIYPDRHYGINCFLLNIGFAEFNYNDHSRVILKSIPSLYLEHDIEYEATQENINFLRTELEFSQGLERCKVRQNADPFVFVFDGPLYFGYLNNKPEKIKKHFLSSYISLLNSFYINKIPIIGFLSAPRNKEIINVIKMGLSKKIIDIGLNTENIDFKFISDSDFIALFLKPFSRTILFSLSSDLALNYPEHLRPMFCYINCAAEIVRIEFPYWLTKDPNFEHYLNILIDQCKKGNGYPIALSEAHEQAVVKSSDRNFFYESLSKMSSSYNHRLNFSQKSIKKRVIGL